MPETMHSPADGALYRAAARATLAPSIHNTQPWRFVVHDGVLDMYEDVDRAVPVIDASGRQRAMSLGGALCGARLSLAAARVGSTCELLPDADEPTLMARVTVTDAAEPDPDARRLDAAARNRRSNRREFGPERLPEHVVDALARAAALEGAQLQHVTSVEDRTMVATLVQHADYQQQRDPKMREELKQWVSDDPNRRDGVPVNAIPKAGHAHDDVPIRQFDLTGQGELPAETHSSMQATLFVLTTPGDHLRDWLTAGQALYRVLLEITDAGYVASMMSQVMEVERTRDQLRHELRLNAMPQMLMRAGVAAATAPTPRRDLSDVISMGSPAADRG